MARIVFDLDGTLVVCLLLHTEGYSHAPGEALPHTAAFSDFAELPGLIAGLLEARAIA